MHALLLAVALAAPATAQPTAPADLGAFNAGDLTGVVRDSASGQGLAGGDVIVSRDSRIVVRSQTDAAGRFRIHNLPDGDYDVEVRLLGFRPTTSRVSIGGTEHDTELSVLLVPSIAHLQELEATAPVPVAVDTRTGNQVFKQDNYHGAPTQTTSQIVQQSIGGAARAATGEVHIL